MKLRGVVQAKKKAKKKAKLTCFKELRFAETTALAVSPLHHAKEGR
jgi:glycine betaine/choline ABC-type transport system substrate-binding protein